LFGGNYIVESLTHQAQPGEWTMDMKLRANHTNASGMAAELAGKPKSETVKDPNTQRQDGLSDQATGINITALENL